MRIPMQSDNELQQQVAQQRQRQHQSSSHSIIINNNNNNASIGNNLGLSKQHTHTHSGQNSHSSLQVLQSLQQLQQVHALTNLRPNASPNPIVSAPTPTTANSNKNNAVTVSALDSIAAAAVTQLDERQERLRKRRSQIAAASRKSRAKRKREVTILKTENERLSSEIVGLKKRLKELGEDVSLDVDFAVNVNVSGDDNDTSSNKSNTNTKMNVNGSEENFESGSSSGGEPNLDSQSRKGEVNFMSVKVENPNSNASTGKEEVKQPKKYENAVDITFLKQEKEIEFTTTKDFFKKRLAIYFNQLKTDTINHLAPEAADVLKHRLSSLEVELVSSSSGNDSDSK